MISYSDALQIIREAALSKELQIEDVSLDDAVGRICARSLSAGLDIQPFDNSAMDGFAVRLDDFEAADTPCPVQLRRVGVIGAGKDPGPAPIESGTCWQIMTGAMLPAGTDAVIPVENAVIEGDQVSFNQKPVAGQHIRAAGEDFKRGAPLISQGDKITSAHVLPLATVGISSIPVFKKPKILFISTGTEIVDDLSARLQIGQIYNSNKLHAVTLLRACGMDVTAHETIRDDIDRFVETLREADQDRYDIIVSSGAVSAGNFDFVKEGLERSGARILYHKIRLKPGKPNLMAILPSGTLYFGLPGNPVATAVGLRFFVIEACRIIMRQKPETPLYARSMNAFSKKAGLHMILKGCLEYWEDGSVTVDILEGQESFKVSPFLAMDCWIQVPEDRGDVKSGDAVEVFPFLL